ncbi:helicase-associated domain-containing protein [soil metagenome]
MSSTRPRSLSDWLRGRTDEWLAALLVARPDLALPPPADMGVLANRIGSTTSLARALEDLDAFTLQVLDGLLISPGTTSYAELRRLLGPEVPEPPARAALDLLRDRALIWGVDEELHVVGSVRHVSGAYPAGLGRPVADLLDRVSRYQLDVVLGWLGLAPARPTEARGAIAAAFADPVQVGALLERCGEGERAVLAQLIDAPLGQVPDADRPTGPGDEGNPVRWLLGHGLMVAIAEDTVELPREVGLALRGDRPLGPSLVQRPDVATQEIGIATVDKTAAGAVLTVLRHVEQLLESCAEDPPAVLRAGGLGVRELRRLARSLDLSEAQAALHLEVAHAAGLLDSSFDASAQWLPTRAYDLWLTQSPAQRWVALAHAWLSMTRWPTAIGDKDDRGKTVNALSLDTPRIWAPAIRRRTLEVLADIPAGHTALPETLVGALSWLAPRRLPAGRAPRVAAVVTEGEQLGVLGRGALGSAGRAVLSGAEGAAEVLACLLPEPVDHVLVQADLTVVAPGPLEPALAREIALIADVESSGGATVYRIEEATVRRALDAGRSAAELHELVRSRSRTPVPQALSYLIDDVARRHGRVRAGAAAAYLRCDEESLVAQLLADRRTAGLRLRRIAPTVLVSPAPVTDLLEVLRSAGYAPAAEDPEGAVLATRRDARRLTTVSRVPAATAPRRPTTDQLAEVVRKIQAGDRATRDARRMPVTTMVPGVTTASTLEVLQRAAREDRPVWLGYVDAHGGPSQRIVDVVSLGGGYLQAFDHIAGAPRTFALHRVTSAALLDA